MSGALHRFVALSGGVGGAKLCLGLAQVLGERLSIIVNTGDDFEHLGLHISPDVDTALYTLAGIVNPETGWGRRDETWTFMRVLGDLGGPTWFKLGDNDLALHALRTARLRRGETASTVCADLAAKLGISVHILPMSDDPVRTMVETDTGRTLSFQEYFVREQCRPSVTKIRFEGAAAAKPAPGMMELFADKELGGIIICPSNPWLSVDPILAVPGVREALRSARAPIVAVSPIIGGKAVKGPAAKIMAELGLRPDSLSIARYYGGLIDGLVIDGEDAALAADMPLPILVTNTLMRTTDDKVTLARTCMQYCAEIASRRATGRPAYVHQQVVE